MNSSTFILRRLRKWRSDKVLGWVFPSIKRYTVITWRRINPTFNISGGNFDGINEFQMIDITFCRTRLGANIVQAIMGRKAWTDGFREQVVQIKEPGAVIRTVEPNSPNWLTFDSETFQLTPEFRRGKLDVTIDNKD